MKFLDPDFSDRAGIEQGFSEFLVGRIFELTKKNAAARKKDINRRIAEVYRRQENDTKHIIHLITENSENMSEEQAAEIGMVGLS